MTATTVSSATAGPAPSNASLSGLDGVNFFNAGILAGFGPNLVAAALMVLIGYFWSYQAIFLTVAALTLPLFVALARIRTADIHFGRACGRSRP
jgi:hypothetical protein